jgi:integrative and conjugative element protein (TIGR02256 family)
MFWEYWLAGGPVKLQHGTFCIVDLSLDPSSGTHASFQRDPALHRQELDKFFDRTGHDYRRFNYLGEWHSHPSFSVRPSDQDLRSMTEMVNTEGSPIAFSALLIVRLRWRLWIDHSLTVFARGTPPDLAQLKSHRVWI